MPQSVDSIYAAGQVFKLLAVWLFRIDVRLGLERRVIAVVHERLQRFAGGDIVEIHLEDEMARDLSGVRSGHMFLLAALSSVVPKKKPFTQAKGLLFGLFFQFLRHGDAADVDVDLCDGKTGDRLHARLDGVLHGLGQ